MGARLFLSLDLHESFFNDPVVIFSIILLSYSSMLRGSISHRALVEKDVSQAVSPTFRSVSLLLFGVSFVSSSLASTALPLGNPCLSKKRVRDEEWFRLWCIGKVSTHCSQTSNSKAKTRSLLAATMRISNICFAEVC